MTAPPSPLTRTEDERRELIAWAADCIERVLPLFERTRPDDARPREALAGARAFARGEARVGPLRRLAVACHAAARDAEDPMAIAVARACGHAAGVAHMASHTRGVPRYTLKAVALARGPDAAAREDAWQRGHLPARWHAYVYEGPDARAVRDLD
jgi:hypothetical protein